MALATWTTSAVLTALCVTAMPDSVPFKTLDGGVQSGIETARQVVVRTSAEWKTLCAQHAEGRPCPAVDFTRSSVIGVFLGTRPTAGISVEITRVERDGDALVVTYRERRPGPGEMAAQMITAPYHLVTVERFAGPVRFIRGQP